MYLTQRSQALGASSGFMSGYDMDVLFWGWGRGSSPTLGSHSLV